MISGATLLSVPTLLGESTKQLDNSHLQHVVIHLGTNDIKKYDGGEIMMNATSAVEKIKKSAPHVDVMFCSVPPRKGTERAQKTANDAASNINNYLKALSRMSDDVSFIDNSPLLAPAGRPSPRLYSSTDPSGVHLSRAGKEQVLTRIVTSLLETENTNDKQSGKHKPSGSPGGAAEHHKKRIAPQNNSQLTATPGVQQQEPNSSAQTLPSSDNGQ